MSADPIRVRDLFLEAIEQPPHSRAAFLDVACGADSELRAEVERLLAAAADPASILEPRPLAGAEAHRPLAEGTVTFGSSGATADYTPQPDEGAVLGGKYKLIEVIGEGGMGSVYMAQQTEPVKRAVAVKVIKAGMDSKAVLARFEAERQALAMMDHPNIARVLDAGTTGSGRPYFVMELVKGVPITQYCDEKKLTPRQRLELFVPVCNAIQHAHQKGIIHRDIKPNNVLVALYDDRPVPKVIDFGVAKATGQSLTDMTLMTGFGAVVGTPEYMSPEQASLNNLDIDTRSDIYSLGVLLYELLTGSTPVDRKSLGKAMLLEILRIVREVEAQRPSAKLSTIATLASVAANRGTEPAKLSKLMKGELDWVLLKALEKDRSRRYESANGFAADVLRYLAGEAVMAVPSSAGYRLKKMLRRNKGQAIAAGLVLFTLVVGSAGTTLGLIEARRQESLARGMAQVEKTARVAEATQRERAEHAERLATDRLELVTLERDRAQKAVRETQAVNNFFIEDMLKAAQPHRFPGSGGGLTVEQVLDNASHGIGAAFRDQPEIEIRLRTLLAAVYTNVGAYEKALSHSRRVLDLNRRLHGPESDSTLRAAIALSLAEVDAGRTEDGIAALRRAVGEAERVRGPGHEVTLFGYYTLAMGLTDIRDYAAGEVYYRKALKGYRETGGVGAALLLSMTLTSLGSNLACQHRDAEAEPLYREAIALIPKPVGEQQASLLIARGGLGRSLSQLNRHKEAETVLREVLDDCKLGLSPGHIATFLAMDDLGVALHRQRRLGDALPYLREAQAGLRFRGGLESMPVETMKIQGHLALLLRDRGEHAEAAALLSEVWETYRRVLGEAHESTRGVIGFLIECLIDAGEKEKALAVAEKLVEVLGRAEVTKAGELVEAEAKLGYLHIECGRLADGHRLLSRCVSTMRKLFGPEDSRTLSAVLNLAIAADQLGNPKEAESLLKPLLALPANHAGFAPPDRLLARYRLGHALYMQRRLDEAAAQLSACLEGHRRTPMPDDAFRATLWFLAMVREGQGRLGDAETLLVEYLAAEIRALGPSGARISTNLSVLGHNRLRQAKYVEAEAPLRESLAIREKLQPAAWTTFNTKSLLGGALLGQRKYANAEPLLLEGYEGMKAREKTIPPQGSTRIAEALDRLVDLYSAMKKPGEVERWQTERAKYPALKEIAPSPREKAVTGPPGATPPPPIYPPSFNPASGGR